MASSAIGLVAIGLHQRLAGLYRVVLGYSCRHANRGPAGAGANVVASPVRRPIREPTTHEQQQRGFQVSVAGDALRQKATRASLLSCPHRHRIRTGLFEPESPLRGNGIFTAETKRPKTALEIQGRRRRDKISLGDPANSGLIAGFREIPVRTRMRGGPGRSPTSGQINGLQKVRVEIAPLRAKAWHEAIGERGSQV